MGKLPNLSETQYRILEVLIAHGALNGAAIREKTGIPRGSIYTTLARMAEKGYVESTRGEVPAYGGPPRRDFKVTGYGAQVYKAASQLEAARSLEAMLGGAL